MTQLHLFALLLALFAGSGIFLGALLSSWEHIRPHWLERELRHTVTATGGGALLAAVALVLVPEGMLNQPLPLAIATFIAGGLGAMALDRRLARNRSSASQLTAMLLDFVPETIVIGAVITKDLKQAIFLAVIIFVQNVPEAFSAYREIQKGERMAHPRLLGFFLAIALSGPLYVVFGAVLLADHDLPLAALMTFCAGGILYLMFQDVAPQVQLRNAWWPPMGALAGFSVGMIGFALTKI